MTERRYATNRPTPTLTRDRDEAQPKCHLRPEWFDALVSTGGAPDDITEAARHACNACPIQAACWAENVDEEWLQRVTGARRKRAAQVARKTWAERTAARIDRLEGLLGAGADVAIVCADLKISAVSLYKWCHRHKRPDLYHRLPGSAQAMPSQSRSKAREGDAA